MLSLFGQLIVCALVVGVPMFLLYAVLEGMNHKPNPYWIKVKPWSSCPICKGSGKVEIGYVGSNDYIDCPCTEEIAD